MGPFKAGELDFKSSPAYYFGEIPVGPFRKPTWCQSAWHEPHASQSRSLNRANTVCCSDEKRGSRGALIVAITPPGLWLIPLRKPHVGGLTSGLTLVRKKRISRRFKSEECNLVKDTAHCVALLEIDFYALPTGEIFLSDGCGWDGMDLWRSLYHVNGVRCGEFRVKLTSRFVYSMRVIRLEFLSFFFFLVFYFILFMRFVALFFLFSKRILTRDSCKFLCHDRFYAIILVTYSKAIIDNYIFKSR